MPITDAYNAPVKDMKFVLHELWDASELSTYEGYEDASPDLIDAMLEESAKFMKNELLPLNQTGDREGCTLENGVVRTPTGFKEAYDKYCENGFTALSTDPKYGGTGLGLAIVGRGFEAAVAVPLKGTLVDALPAVAREVAAACPTGARSSSTAPIPTTGPTTCRTPTATGSRG